MDPSRYPASRLNRRPQTGQTSCIANQPRKIFACPQAGQRSRHARHQSLNIDCDLLSAINKSPSQPYREAAIPLATAAARWYGAGHVHHCPHFSGDRSDDTAVGGHRTACKSRGFQSEQDASISICIRLHLFNWLHSTALRRSGRKVTSFWRLSELKQQVPPRGFEPLSPP